MESDTESDNVSILAVRAEIKSAQIAFSTLMSTFAFVWVIVTILAIVIQHPPYFWQWVSQRPDWQVSLVVMVPLGLLGWWALLLVTRLRKMREEDLL